MPSSRQEPRQSESQPCGTYPGLLGANLACQLERGHDGPHRHEDENGTTTWEPRYVAAMRRELDNAREALKGLVAAATPFVDNADESEMRYGTEWWELNEAHQFACDLLAEAEGAGDD